MDPTSVNIPIVIGISGLSAAFTEFLKRTIIDPHLYKPSDPAHDTFVRGVCFLISLGLTIVSIIPVFPSTGVGWIMLLIQAGTSAGLSIGGYHAVTGSATQSSLTSNSTATSIEPVEQSLSVNELSSTLVAQIEPVLARVISSQTGALRQILSESVQDSLRETETKSSDDTAST